MTRNGFQFSRRRIDSDHRFGAHFTVDLQDDLDFVFFEEGFIVGRPRFIRDALFTSDLFEEFFAEVRSETGEELNEPDRVRFVDRGRLITVVDEDHHLRDRGVEVKRFDVGGDFLDGVVIALVEAVIVDIAQFVEFSKAAYDAIEPLARTIQTSGAPR